MATEIKEAIEEQKPISIDQIILVEQARRTKELGAKDAIIDEWISALTRESLTKLIEEAVSCIGVGNGG
jgi:hypothetical protein